MTKREVMKRRAINKYLKGDNTILSVHLFGSQSKGKSNKYSDIDIAVLFDNSVGEKDYTDKQISLMSDLSKALNKEIDVIILNRASLFLKEGIKTYERPDRNEHNFEALAIMQYLDFLPIKNRIENRLLLKIKKS